MKRSVTRLPAHAFGLVVFVYASVVCATFKPARISLRSYFVNTVSDTVYDGFSPEIRRALEQALDKGFTIEDNLTIRDVDHNRMIDYSDGAGKLRALGVDPGPGRPDFVLIAGISLECAFRTSDDIRIPLIIPTGGNAFGGTGLYKTDDNITITDENPEYHFTAKAYFSLISGSGEIMRTWQKDDDQQSDRGDCQECMKEAIANLANSLFKDCRDVFRFSFDASLSGAADLQLMYGVLDLNSPGIGGGVGGSVRFMPTRFFGAGFEFQLRGTFRRFAEDGSMLVLSTQEELDDEPKVEVSYVCKTFTVLLHPGYVMHTKSPSLDYLFPHLEVAVGWQSVDMHVSKDTFDLSTSVDNSWNFGFGGGALMAFRNVPFGVEPYLRANIGIGGISRADDNRIRELIYLDAIDSNADAQSFFSLSFLIGVRLSFVINTTPIR